MMKSNHLLHSTARLDTIIFDLDDTLINWANPSQDWETYMRPVIVDLAQLLDVNPVVLGAEFGRKMYKAWDDAHKDWIAVSFAGVLHQTCQTLGIEANIQTLLKSIQWKPMPGVSLFPDTLETLTTLQTKGFKLGLITNAWQPMWMRDIELETLGLLPYFEHRITSGDTGFIKPHPAIFWRMMGMLNTTPDRAMYVGDSPSHDVRGANLADMTSVLIQPPHLNKPPIENIPDYTIKTLSDLLPIVENLS